MTERREDFIAAICAELDSDTPRLAFADWLDGQEEHERAELIRVQCELVDGSLSPLPRKRAGVGGYHVPRMEATRRKQKRIELQKRERQLLGRYWSDWTPDIKWGDWKIPGFQTKVPFVVFCDNLYDPKPTPTPHITFTRGFISHLTLSWADWLKIEPVVYWSKRKCERCRSSIGYIHHYDPASDEMKRGHQCPTCHGSGEVEPSDECENCEGKGGRCLVARGGTGNRLIYHSARERRDCQPCSGTGRIPRPFPASALPLEEITIVGQWSDQLMDRLEKYWPRLKFNLPTTDEYRERERV